MCLVNVGVQVECAKITDQLPNYLKVEKFSTFQDEIYRLIARYGKQVNQLDFKCRCNEEIIKRFDEVILEKGSKISIKELELKSIDYEKEHKKIYDLITKVNKRCDTYEYLEIPNLNFNINNMRNQFVKEINELMSDIHEKLKKRFLESAGGNPITRLEFDALLKLKAYQDDLVALDNSKTNCTDTIENTNKLDEFRIFLSQIVYVLFEFLDTYPDMGIKSFKVIKEANANASSKLKKVYRKLVKENIYEAK